MCVDAWRTGGVDSAHTPQGIYSQLWKTHELFLVTGACRLSSVATFVLDWLAQSDEPVINLDALTYAGNLENLASLDGDARHLSSSRASIGDFDLRVEAAG